MKLLSTLTAGAYALLRTGTTYVPAIMITTASAAVTDFRLFDGSTADKTNKVGNGDFSRAITYSWAAGATNWSVVSGSAKHAAPGGTTALQQDITCVANEIYYVTFTISGRTAGALSAVTCGGTSLSGTYNTNATFTEIIKSTNTGNLVFTPEDAFDGSIDDVAVYRLGLYTSPEVRAKYSDTSGNTLMIFPKESFLFADGVVGYLAGTGAVADIYME